MNTKNKPSRFPRTARSVLALSVTAALGVLHSAHAADIKIGVILPLSGPGASQGLPTQKGIQAAAKSMANVNGKNIVMIQLDDVSDPTTSARNARKLIEEDKVDVIIGTTSVPGAMALAAIANETSTPLVSFTPLNLQGDKAQWSVTTVQPTQLIFDAAVKHMHAAGVKSIGYIGFSDSWGDLAYDSLQKAIEGKDMSVVTNERYARSDISVAGQALKISAKKPDAVIGGTAGSPGALPYLALDGRNYKGKLYGTHAILNKEFVKLTNGTAEGLLAPTGPILVADQLPDSHPSKQPAQDFRKAYQAVHNALPEEVFSAYAYDAWSVVANAASRVAADVEPGTPAYRTALRDAIFSTKELAVNHGVLNYALGNPYGSDERSVVIVKLEKDQWVLQP